MKSLSNFTNGYMILADSFNMSIFKQSFQRVFAKDEQGHLRMGFNATFDVQVSDCRFQIRVNLKRQMIPDDEGAQSIRIDRSRHLSQQEISLDRGNGNWNRSNLRLENLFPLSQNFQRRLFRSRHSSRSNPTSRSERNDSIRHSLSTFFRSISTPRHFHRS